MKRDKTSNSYLRVITKSLTTLNWFEWLLLSAILLITIVKFTSNFLSGEPITVNGIIAAVAAILGVFCVVLGAKGSLANWIFGVVEAFLHIYICFCSHIYGDVLQRLLYNLPMQFIGWNKWKKRERNDGSQTIHTRYMTWKQRIGTLLSVAIGTLALGLFLKCFGPWLIEVLREAIPNIEFETLKTDYDTQSQLWLDSFTTVMSIITMYISVKAFVEQWYMWLIINIAYIFMWLMSDSVFSFMTVAKYSVYLVNSFYGIYMWHKLSK